MIVEIHGGQFKNKGAQKMLLTVISRMKLINKDIIFVVDPCVGSDKELQQYGIKKLSFSHQQNHDIVYKPSQTGMEMLASKSIEIDHSSDEEEIGTPGKIIVSDPIM